MNRILLAFTICLFALPFTSDAQYLLSVDYLGIETKPQLEARFGVPVRNSVEKYAVTYMATGINGEPDTASGLILVPTTPLGGKTAVVAYQHGTTNGWDDVPSTQGSGMPASLAYGAMGYYVSATDYLGMGVNDGFHPYVHAGTEASAGFDMLVAMSEFLETEEEISAIDFLFVSGYSQGGHGAMALQQLLEENWAAVYPMTASTPMSGPYSISDVMFEQMVGDVPYSFVSYPIYAMLGHQEVYGNIYDSLQQVFKGPFIPAIEAFYNRQIDLTTLTTSVFANLLAQGGVPLVRNMFTNPFYDSITTNEDHPLRQALRQSDTYEWTTNTPTRLLYCTADDQVPFMNTILADSVMNELGATDLMRMDMNPDANHVECATPAILESVAFFDSFVIETSTSDVTVNDIMFAYPNPADRFITVDLSSHPGEYQFSLYNTTGQPVMSLRDGSQSRIDVSALPPGMYILQAESDEWRFTQKIMVR